MRLDRLILTGLSDAFPGVVDLSLGDLPDGLVALTGPNGQGKSTILEATPGAVYRKLPSHDDVDPIEYALGRESSIDLSFTFEGIGAFRSRVSLDGPKRKSDAVLEQILADGSRQRLTDGKVSTYDTAITDRFPSFELFLNSSYAAQGRGDEFTRAKPSARKDLFAEFLALRSYFDRAKTASAAADLVGDARLRLEAQADVLERDTAPALLQELECLVDALQTQGGQVRVDQELLEWQDLAKALGKGGLPDLEIDAAGPTITATTNELLAACFGPRFSLELVTQVAKADGDGMKDLFTVLVLDNEAPARGWKDLKFLSGGQKVVVQEALMCAIAVYVNARAALPIRTLWRDETGAALDPVNAIAYVHMLRKVRELGRFHHVFFITHDAASAALADAQIRCGGGHAAIVQPPFSEAA